MREGCFAGNWCQFNPALRSTWPVLTVREARWSLDDEGGGFVNPPFPRKHARTHARTRARASRPRARLSSARRRRGMSGANTGDAWW